MSTMTSERELLSSYLDDGGWHTEAENVRNGVDLDSYEIELRLIDWLHRHTHLAQPVQAVDVVVLRARMNGKAWQYYAPDYLSPEAISKLAEHGWEFERLARALSGEKAGPVDGWQPIETAPKDGRKVLLLCKPELYLPAHCRGFADVQFVGRWLGRESEWCFAAPVGHGGIPDGWLAGWQPIPASPAPDKER